MSKIYFGGDYNPEQWPREIWQEDMRLFHQAKINIATVGVFAWSLIQKDEETYDFAELDEIMNTLKANNIDVCLGTGTAAHPAWMARKYPDVLRVDFEGRKHKFGQRHNSCPNSPTYIKYSRRMAEKLAERYKDYDNIIAWHVSNEYGGTCYCENCAKAFRVWLKKKYKTLDALNKAWNTRFWSHIFYEWEDIVPPNNLSEHLGRDTKTAFEAITLEYMRFNSDGLLSNYLNEKEVLNQITPDIPVMTNFMGMYKPLDYFKWAEHLDVIGWDNYPPDMKSQARMALTHDLMRGLKKGKPFWVMEQTPSATSTRDFNPLKRPGIMRLWSYQAIAHGSDAIMFFQMRKSVNACEKFFGAVISHHGGENTRVFKECEALGKELEALGDQFVGAETRSRVAMLFDWDNWWAVEMSDGPSRYISYQQTMIKFYKALYELNISVDLISMEDDLTGYDVVIAPLVHMIKDDFHEKVESFVAGGGSFVTTFYSGIVDECNNVTLEGYPGKLRKVMGTWVEETDALAPDDLNEICINGDFPDLQGTYKCHLLFDIMHPETAEVVGVYGSDFYKGTPVVTRNTYGDGEAWYIGSDPEVELLEKIFRRITEKHGVKAPLEFGPGVEVTTRNKGNQEFVFVLNHTKEEKETTVSHDYSSLLNGESVSKGQTIKVKGNDVLILEKKS